MILRYKIFTMKNSLTFIFCFLGKYSDVIYDDLKNNSSYYCDPTAYMHAFVLLLFAWIVIAFITLAIIGLCCFKGLCCFCLFYSDDNDSLWDQKCPLCPLG